jgi:uncharacterized protein (DUF885 family)
LQFERIHSIKPNVDKLFSLQPKTKFEIKNGKALTREKTASAEYNQGAADGSRPGLCPNSVMRIQYVW